MTHQILNNTLSRSNSHSFKSNIALRTKSHKITNLNESQKEQSYKIKSPNTNKIAKANYQNQDSIFAVDTNLTIIHNTISIVQLCKEFRTITQVLQNHTISNTGSIL